MKIQRPFSIVGYGTSLPKNIIRSDDLERQLGISEGWSYQHSGVLERRHVQLETNSDLAADAVTCALRKAKISLEKVDLLIAASATFDQPLPHRSALIKHALDPEDRNNFSCIDINTSCLSFVSALDVASLYLLNDAIQNIVIVSAEIASKGLDAANWKTATLFGDAAAAIILSRTADKDTGWIKYAQKTYSRGVHAAQIKGGGNKYFFKEHAFEPELHTFQMDSKPLLRMAMLHVKPFVDSFFADLKIDIKDVDVIIPHQASKTGLRLFKQMYNLKPGQLFENLKYQGNCIAASIPTALCQALGQDVLRPGNLCLLFGTSAGFGIGALLFRV